MTCTKTCTTCTTPCALAKALTASDVRDYVELETARVHVSKGNSKIGKIDNISVLSGAGLLTFKDGRIITNELGTCHGCCEFCDRDCYAKKAYRYHGYVIACADNTLLMRHDPEKFYRETIVARAAKGSKLMRIHVGGEFDSYDDMRACFDAARIADKYGMQLFTYTKRYEWLESLMAYKPDNLSVLTSIWGEFGRAVDGCGTFVMDDGTDPVIQRMPHCPAVAKNGKRTSVTCDGCMRCPKGLTTAVYKH